MNQNINIQEIERYLSGQMPDNERVAFELEIENSPSLAEQVRLIQEMDEALQDSAAVEAQRTIQKISDDFFLNDRKEIDSTSSSAKFRLWAALVAGLLLLTIVLLFWQSQGKSSQLSNETLFAEYYSVEKISEQVRGDESREGSYKLALNQYRQGHYSDAIRSVEQTVADQPEQWQSVYLLAHSYLNNKQYDFARTAFQSIVDDGKSIYAPRSSWFLALIAIKQGNKAEARLQLNELLSSEDPSLKDKAKELLSVMN